MYSKYVLSFLIVLVLVSCKSSTTKSSSHKAKYEPPKYVTHSSHPAVKKAKTYLGTPYKYCGMDHDGIDCSGLVFVSFKDMNINLPRIASDQSKKGKRVYIGELHEGDLVFFKERKNGGNKITHVGIISQANYPSSVIFIHSSTSKGVREDELMSGYWKDLYVMAVRIEG